MHTVKKSLHILISCAILTSACAFSSCASEGNGLQYTLLADGKSYAVSGVETFLGTHLYREEVVIPSSYKNLPVTRIDDNAFVRNTRMTSLTIPNSIVYIGDHAFSGCSALTTITLPDSVGGIGSWVFEDCSSLTNVTLSKSVISIGYDPFENCNSLTNIEVDENNPAYMSIDGNLYTKDGTRLIQYSVGKTQTGFTIPESVTQVDSSAFTGAFNLTTLSIPGALYEESKLSWFYSRENLTSVIIGEGATSIDERDFFACINLQTLRIPSSVAFINRDAFTDCTQLTDITVMANNAQYQSIDGNLYDKEGRTLIQYAVGKAQIEFVIPDTVVYIGNKAFMGAKNLQSVTIPKSVTDIYHHAFDGCVNLTSVSYQGTESEWLNIQIDPSGNEALEKATKHYEGVK
ncbi:MAG: leucine-rich repeat domain-containing protein [Clostridia bacterium]|nr:leucine-rich repeat domain-containing protein [Clostridia bacterium]